MTAGLPEGARSFIEGARVARLATVTPDGRLHVVPVCPALDGERILISTEPTQKVRNLEADPRVGLAFDHYDEDWSALRGVTLSGRARIHRQGPVWDLGRDLLYAKFPQYPGDSPIDPGRTLMIEVEVDWVSTAGT